MYIQAFFLGSLGRWIFFFWEGGGGSLDSMFKNKRLLYLLVSTCAVIGQFSGPYSPVRPAKI